MREGPRRGEAAGQPSAWRQTAIYAAGIALSRSTGLVLLPIATHVLPPAEYGRLEFLTSVIIAGVLISSLWLVETLYRFAAAPEEEGRRAAADVTGLSLVIALLLAGVLFGAPTIAAILPLPTPPIEVALAGAVIAAEAMNAVPLGWLRMRNRAWFWAMLTVGRMVLHLILATSLLTAGFGVAGVLAAGATASLLTGIVLLGAQWREGGIRFAPSRWKPLIVFGAPLTVSGLALFALGSADLWFLAGHVTPAELGIYAVAAKMALIAGVATQPFDLWWYPRRLMVLREENGIAKSARLAGFGAALALVCAAAVAILGPLLVLGLTPRDYHGAATLLPWMAAAIAIQTMGTMVNVGCYVGRSGGGAGAINLVAALCVLVLYWVLIPRLGVAGAIAATIAAQLLRLGLFAVFSLRAAPIPYPFGAIALFALGCAATAALPQLVQPRLVGTAAGLLAFAASLLLAAYLRLTPSGRRPF